MGSLAGDGFIGALLPASAEPEWVRADGSMKDTEEVGCWPTPSKMHTFNVFFRVSAFTNGSSPFSVGAIYINLLTAAPLVHFSVNIVNTDTINTVGIKEKIL